MNRISRVTALTILIVIPSASVVAQSNYSRVERVEYYDDPSLWVMGQVKKITCEASIPVNPACDGGSDSVIKQLDYGWRAMPWKEYSFGKLRYVLAYDANADILSGQLGSLRAVKDGNGHTTAFSSWHRGIPQLIKYPPTLAAQSGAMKAAEVNYHGEITATVDELKSRTCYEYDSAGRLSKIRYTSESSVDVCSSSHWAETVITYSRSSTPKYGLPLNHWRQTTLTANRERTVYFDALWRPVVVEEVDRSSPAATRSVQVTKYDSLGRVTFSSYPLGNLVSVLDSSIQGERTVYDTFDRPLKVLQDWEGPGQLATTFEYLPGFRTKVTDPKLQTSLISYIAWDVPTYDFPEKIMSGINSPDASYVAIDRDAFGKPYEIQKGSSVSALSVSRIYQYNIYQELCRSVEPESGATLMGYDGAGNLSWSSSGLPGTTACHPTGNDPALNDRKIVRRYDAQNRLLSIEYADGVGNQEFKYTVDGLVSEIATKQATSEMPYYNRYQYNRRRLLTSESQALPSGDEWLLGHTHSTYGDVSSTTYPSGLTVAFEPNALGQPTKVGTFVTDVLYHPNGHVKSYRYGNGLRREVSQYPRGLTERICDSFVSCNASSVLFEEYDYDPVGNLLAISDGRTGNRSDRSMQYDSLNRLKRVESPMFGVATYTYDALDNITRASITAGNQPRAHHYCYDANWRVTNIKTGSCAGPTVIGMGYDDRGNLENRNGVVYDFDLGNRLRRAGAADFTSYTYDGYGRRITAKTGPANPRTIRSMYDRSGVLVYEKNPTSWTEYYHLGGRLVAHRSRQTTVPGSTAATSYRHTDLLGTPVTITNGMGIANPSDEYEPYGRASNRSHRNGIGFTGHREDASGLIYMQQRYYDPQIGRFLSVDPVTAYDNPIDHFHRYRYANNNPYKFTDPDGRQAVPDKPLVFYQMTTRTTTDGGAVNVTRTNVSNYGIVHGTQTEVRGTVTLLPQRSLGGTPANPGPAVTTRLLNFSDKSGQNIEVTSGQRTAEQNRAVGGASRSQHLQDNAADIRISGNTPKQTADAAHSSGEFNRVNQYTDGRGVHVDLKKDGTQGRFTDWKPNK